MDEIMTEMPYPVRVDTLPDLEKVFKLAATDEQRKALAVRYGVIDVVSLTAIVRVKRQSKGKARLSAEYECHLVQQCVVSLSPMETSVIGQFSRQYSPVVDVPSDDIVVDLNDNPRDPPELVVEGVIDIGEAVAEEIALNINLFPRRDDASFTLPQSAENGQIETSEPNKPFASLAALKKKLERDN